MLVELVVGLLTLGGLSGPGDRSFSNAFVLVCLDPGDAGRVEYLEQFPAFVEWVMSARRLPGAGEILLPVSPRPGAGRPQRTRWSSTLPRPRRWPRWPGRRVSAR